MNNLKVEYQKKLLDQGRHNKVIYRLIDFRRYLGVIYEYR